MSCGTAFLDEASNNIKNEQIYKILNTEENFSLCLPDPNQG